MGITAKLLIVTNHPARTVKSDKLCPEQQHQLEQLTWCCSQFLLKNKRILAIPAQFEVRSPWNSKVAVPIHATFACTTNQSKRGQTMVCPTHVRQHLRSWSEPCQVHQYMLMLISPQPCQLYTDASLGDLGSGANWTCKSNWSLLSEWDRLQLGETAAATLLDGEGLLNNSRTGKWLYQTVGHMEENQIEAVLRRSFFWILIREDVHKRVSKNNGC